MLKQYCEDPDSKERLNPVTFEPKKPGESKQQYKTQICTDHKSGSIIDEEIHGKENRTVHGRDREFLSRLLIDLNIYSAQMHSLEFTVNVRANQPISYKSAKLQRSRLKAIRQQRERNFYRLQLLYIESTNRRDALAKEQHFRHVPRFLKGKSPIGSPRW